MSVILEMNSHLTSLGLRFPLAELNLYSSFELADV